MKQITPPRSGSLHGTPASRRVLAIVGDTQVGLWAVRSLGRGGLRPFCVCASPRGLAAHSRYCSGAWQVEGKLREPRWLDQVVELARRLDVGSVLTIAEGYHQVLIAARQRFEPGVHVFSPSAESFAKATDKDFMHALALRLGVPVARGTTLDRLMAGQSACGEQGRADGALKPPLVLRTRRQNAPDGTAIAPWKAAYAESDAQLHALYEQVRPIAANVLVQEYHPGVEDHVQVLMHRGKCVMAGEYIGEHHMPLAGGVTVQRVTCRHERLIADAVRLLQAIGWEGVAGVQFHYDPRTDRYIFLEINPRFIGGLPTVIMGGFDAPLLLWQSHFEPDRMRPGQYELGMRTRILGGDANWMLGMIRGDRLPPGQKRLGKFSAAGQFLWNFGPWTRDDVFSLSDPRPALVDWRSMIRRLGQGTVDIVGNPEGAPTQ